MPTLDHSCTPYATQLRMDRPTSSLSFWYDAQVQMWGVLRLGRRPIKAGARALWRYVHCCEAINSRYQ